MPPSLVFYEPYRPSYLSKMASVPHSRPLTLALSLGRGHRFVDAREMLEVRAAPPESLRA